MFNDFGKQKLKDFGLDQDMVQEAFSNYNRIHNFWW